MLQVGKRLLLLYVQPQGGGGALDLSTPRCLARLAIQERLLRRWVPEAQRPEPAKPAGQQQQQRRRRGGKQ